MSHDDSKTKKPSRAATLERVEEVAAMACGESTELDQAFAMFDENVGDDPQALEQARLTLRALLARR
jgi:hypothetical protein